MSDATRSHPKCWGPQGHICQEPSGRACIEKGCDQPAGTHWGPYWCPEHDVERLDRISANLDSMLDDLIPCEGSGCPAHSVRFDYGICSMCGAAVAVHAGRVARAHDRFDAAGLPAPTSREEQ
jgi:hypothetical protein